MYFKRTLENRLLDISGQFPVVLLTGPRQVGKTTLLRHLCGPERRYVTLDDLTLRSLANEDPALFLQRFPPPLLIDEVQYAPYLFPYIKMAVDSTGDCGAYWLTGSQQFHMMRSITESLAGRVAIVNLLGFSRREQEGRLQDLSPFLPLLSSIEERRNCRTASDLISVYNAIWTGSFPVLHAGPVSDRNVFYSSYLQTYLQRDVRDLTQVGDQQTFLRFVRACAARTGQILNLSELARDVEISSNTAKAWLSILIASFQVVLLQPYHTNFTKRLVKRPKLYFLDTGFCAYLTDWSSPEALSSGAMSGAIFETHVLGELLKSWWHCMRSPNLFYFRDKDCTEIDFVLELNQTLYPLEVKRNATPKRDWGTAFSTLERLGKPVGSGAVICFCEDPIPLKSNVTAIPVGLL